MQLLDEFFKGQVLMRVSAERRLFHSLKQLAERRSPDMSVRSTSMLTKNPMSGSNSAREASGDGRPDDDAVDPVRCSKVLEGTPTTS